MIRGKKYIAAANLIERGNLYEKAEAVALVKKSAVAKFDETNEAHIRKGCDGRHADQQIRGAVVLPHGTGQKVRILVFAKDAKAEEAKAAGGQVPATSSRRLFEMIRGKKYIAAANLIERGNLYEKAEAVALVKKSAVAKFDETNEAHIRKGCDGRHADQQIRGAVVLPHGTGQKVRILVFAKDAKAEEAKAAGSEYVGAEDLIPKIQNE